MKYGANRNLCANCQFWTGRRTAEAFTVDVEDSLAVCVVKTKNGPKRAAHHQDCPDFKKWDKIKR